MANWKHVESTVKPKKREINFGTYYLRKNIELKTGTEDKPDMWTYEQAMVTPDEYLADFEDEFEKLQEAVYGNQ